MHRLIATEGELLPVMRDRGIVLTWAGIEGSMPDGMPVPGASVTAPDVIHAFGFSVHGFQLGRIGGRIDAEHIETGESSLPIAPSSMRRFRPLALREAA